MQLTNPYKTKGNNDDKLTISQTPVQALTYQAPKHRRYYWLLTLAFFGLAWSWSAAFAEETSGSQNLEANEIQQILIAKQHPLLTPADFENRSEDLDALYQASHYQWLWLGREQTEKNINDLLSILDNAYQHGLDPAAYDVGLLREQLPAILRLNKPQTKPLAAYDTALSLALLRFLHDLRYGRVNPQGIDFKLKLREKKPLDLPLLIKDSLALGTLAQLPDRVEPKLRQYRQLKSALASYRELALKVMPLQLSIDQSLKPGHNFNQAEALRQFLRQIGDLPETAEAGPADRYSEDLVTAIKRFQLRHGLAVDGVIGKATLAELNTPLSQRLPKIELAMERLRWLPKLSSEPSIIVNIPAFQLWAFDNINALEPAVTTMKVVVGRALKHQTPVLMAEMRYVDFMPYWNVPYSIVKKEIIPKLLANPGYLAKENMELVSGSKAVGFSWEAIDLLKQGKARIRQRPGKKNSLGRVKFLFPNKDNVYLHDTPANTLFKRSRRDFSHGCVRVEKPQKLAEFALKNQDGWNADRIKAAMNASKTQRVTLNQPISVMFFYITAFFDQDHNLIFYPDIYGHDAILREALKKREDISDRSLFASPSAPPMISQVETIKTAPGTNP